MKSEDKLISVKEITRVKNSLYFTGRQAGRMQASLDSIVQKLIDMTPPADSVEVVRCKDCKYCDPENMHCDHPMATTLPIPRNVDDFCSYGERKDNEAVTHCMPLPEQPNREDD